MKDYYKILGISRDATKQDIKNAFRKLSLQYHPDRQGNKSEKEKKDAEAKFKEIAEAYEVLGNDSKKSQYDSASVFGNNIKFESFRDPFSIFDDFFNIFHESNNMGWGGMATGTKNLEMDVVFDLLLELSDVYNLTHKQIIFTRKIYCEKCDGNGYAKMEKCPHCHGTGINTDKLSSMKGFYIHKTCTYCGGTGYISKTKCDKCGGNGFINQTDNLDFSIPAGCYDGYTINYGGKGNILGNRRGDLFIRIHIHTGTNYRISPRTLNLETTIEVPILTCLIGGNTQITLPDKTCISVNIPENTSTGSIYKIRGKGLMKKDMSRGDLLICIHYKMPKHISDADKKILKKIALHDDFL